MPWVMTVAHGSASRTVETRQFLATLVPGEFPFSAEHRGENKCCEVQWSAHSVTWLNSKATFLPILGLANYRSITKDQESGLHDSHERKGMCMHAFPKFTCKDEYCNRNEETFIRRKWAAEIGPPPPAKFQATVASPDFYLPKHHCVTLCEVMWRCDGVACSCHCFLKTEWYPQTLWYQIRNSYKKNV